MKILILLSGIDQTGMTMNTLDLVKGLMAEKQEVYVITGGQVEKNNIRLDQILTEFKNSGAKIKFYITPKGSRFKQKIISAISVFKILYLITSIKPQVIHSQSPYMSFIPWLLKKRFTSTLHVNDLEKSFKYKKASHLIAISQETYDYAVELFNYKREDISIVNHGVSIKYAKNLTNDEKVKFKKDNNIPINKIIIGFVGSIEKRKGHDLLLKAIELLEDPIKNQIHVIFLGSSKDGKTTDWLNNLIIETSNSRLVSCFEYQDPIKFYSVFDIFTLPSRLEGFGLVVIEAMMSGCCIIRSNTQGAYDQIDHGINGLLFENNNFHELSKLLTKVIKDKTFRLNLAKNGKEKALKKFTIEEMTKGTIEVYKKVQLY